jgi:hypothetical protein
VTTTNLGMTLPSPGSSSDTWGDLLNAAFGVVDTFAGKLMGAAEVTVASASTCDIGAAASTAVAISGTTTITSLGTATNTIRFVRFTGTSLILTHNASSLISPTGANIQTAAGDCMIAKSDGSGNWRIMSYRPVGNVVDSNASVTSSGSLQQVASISVPAGRWKLSGMLNYNGGGSGITFGQILIGPNSASGSGTVFGTSFGKFACSASDTIGGGSITGFDVTLSGATTYYLNGSLSGSSGTLVGYIRAERLI